jgi:hypothetical protein
MDIDNIHADDIGNAAAFKTATNKTKGHRSCFTKRETALQLAITDLAAHPADDREDQGRKGLTLLEEAHIKLENAFCFCLALLTDQDEENATLLNDQIDFLSRETTRIRGDA